MASLNVGKAGPEVARLQRALAAAGYLTGAVDGKYGKGTADAVRKLQLAKGLTADGKAGTSTHRALGLTFGADRFDFQPRSGPNLKDPALTKEDSANVEYRRVGGDLFVDGVSAEDVVQGDVGNCYFLSGVAAIAHAQPDALKDAITQNPDGTFRVRLFDKNGKATYQTVDRDLPFNTEKGELAYGQSVDPKELWVAVLEKAYAQTHGAKGYEGMAPGGKGNEAFVAVLGKRTRSTDLEDQTADQLWATLSRATSQNVPVTTTTNDLKKAVKDRGLQDNHAYTVLGVSVENGERMIRLRDPWSTKELGNGADGMVDGVFTMRFSEWKQLFGDMHLPV